MYIDSSCVNMASSHSYSNVVYAKSAEMTMSTEQAAAFTLSDKGKSAVEQLDGYKKEVAKKDAEQQKESLKESYNKMMAERTKGIESEPTGLKTLEDFKMQLIQKLLDSFSRRKNNRYTSLEEELFGTNRDSMTYKMSTENTNASSAIGVALMADVSTTSVWTKVTAQSYFEEEKEQTAYQANGLVTTKDGRQIQFGVTVEMSRSFCQKYESLTKEDYVFTDPLVINLDTNVANISDQKFLFDLDADGKKEEMSFVDGGSGFLALDKNGDGTINDGNELFGTKSGDGFKDLAAYDDDGNGWIDEADDIYKNLKVWTKDENGNDYLMTLKEADVGAIYLGNTSTDFSLNEAETNATNAVIRSTGVFLRESSGAAGTVQHLDFAV